MKHTILSALIVSAMLAFGTVVADGGNDPQTGESECLDAEVGWLIDGHFFGDTVVTDAGTDYAVSHGGDSVIIDFYDAEGTWLAWTTETEGTVPEGSAQATVCVQTTTTVALVSVSTQADDGSYIWQDGF